MNIKLNAAQKRWLEVARMTYGDFNQIMVSNEELCELAAVCAKYPRFSNPEEARKELHLKALDEVADVIIVLDHIVNIFGLGQDEIDSRIAAKIDRLERWLSTNDSMDTTTKDRYVEGDSPIEDEDWDCK